MKCTLTVAFVILLASYAVAAQYDSIWKMSRDRSYMEMTSGNHYGIKPADRDVLRMWMPGNTVKISRSDDAAWPFLIVNSSMDGKVKAKIVKRSNN